MAGDTGRIRIRVDRCEVHPLPDGRYEVVIEGYNLHGAIVPPTVTVGGVTPESLRFQRDGLVLRGILARQPQDKSVVVDYGFARASLKDPSASKDLEMSS